MCPSFICRGAAQGRTRAETQAGNVPQNWFANDQCSYDSRASASRSVCLFLIPAVNSEFSLLCQKVDPKHSEGDRVLPASKRDVTELSSSLRVSPLAALHRQHLLLLLLLLPSAVPADALPREEDCRVPTADRGPGERVQALRS